MGNNISDKIVETLSNEQLSVYNLLSTGKSLRETSDILGINYFALRKRVERFNTKLKQIGVPFLSNPIDGRANLSDHLIPINGITEKKSDTLIGEGIEEISKVDIDAINYKNKLKVERYKQEANDLKKIMRKYIREESRFESKLDILRECIVSYKPKDLIKRKTFNLDKSGKKVQAIICISDSHIGEVVRSESMLDMNRYDIDIAIDRFNQLFNEVINSLKHLKDINIEQLNIYALGDLVCGNPHLMHPQELGKDSETITNQQIICGEILADFIRNLSPYFKKIRFVGVPGNHGRTTQKQPCKYPEDNHDVLAMYIASIKCENINNVEFKQVSGEDTIEKIYDTYVYLKHGSNTSTIQAMRNMCEKITKTITYHKNRGEIIYYVFLAHIHEAISIPFNGGRLIVNGSIKGADEYVKQKLGLCSAPMQKLLLIDENGKLDWCKDIELV